MIYVIHGENAFVREHLLHARISDAGVQPERISVDTLTLAGLADIVRGGSLFSQARCIVIRQLSADTQLFTSFTEWITEVPSDTTIILTEPKLDKRTKAAKTLLKHAEVLAVDVLTERDERQAKEWLLTIAKGNKVSLTGDQATQMIQRALVEGDKPNNRIIDQMQLYRAIQALRGVQAVTDEAIATVLPPAIGDSVFDLLEMATKGQVERVNHAIADLQPTDDGYRVVGLIFGQWAQLAAVAAVGDASPQTAADLGIHPFVVKRLHELASQFSRSQIRSTTQLAAQLDAQLKVSHITPWDAIYQLLHTIATR